MRIFIPHIKNTITRKLDPRTGLIVSCLWAFFLCFIKDYNLLLLFMIIPAISAVVLKIPFREILLRAGKLNMFLAFLFIILPFSHSGGDGFNMFGLFYAYSGLIHALVIILKANIVMLFFTVFVSFYEPVEIGKALKKLWIPEKLIVLFLFTVRYIETIHLEYHRLRDAMAVRGFNPVLSTYTLKVFAVLIGQMLVRSLDRSERVLEAMKCRGFNGKFYLIDHKKLKVYDYAVFLICFMVFGGVFYLV